MADSTIRLLPSLWGRCDVHGVLVKVGTQCSACVGDGEGKNLKLRTEHFEIGEPQPGWTVDALSQRAATPGPRKTENAIGK